MDKDFLITILQNIKNPKKEYRNEAALKIIENPDLFYHLIDKTFHTDDILSVRASLILEWICTHYDLDLLFSHLIFFTENLNKLHFDGSVRSCAKICEQTAKTYHSKKKHEIQNVLTKKQIDCIIEISFDWLITPQKVAVKAYTMTTLYYFGLEISWVHDALQEIITKDIIHQSKAYETRGKKILTLIHNKEDI